MTREGLPCIVCGRSLINAFQDVTNQPEDGTTFTSHGQYGSTAYDPMDGRYIEINLCDPCLLDARKKERVLEGRDRRLVVSDADDLPNVIVGWMTVNRTLETWRNDTDGAEEPFFVEHDEIGSPLLPEIEWDYGGQSIRLADDGWLAKPGGKLWEDPLTHEALKTEDAFRCACERRWR